MLAAVVRNNILSVEDIADPMPRADEALVRVAASSVNQGEVRAIGSQPHWQLRTDQDNGWCPGWDFAGWIERAAADGTGPAKGARVVGWVRQGAWAERVAAPIQQLVLMPDTLDFMRASTLPIAGLTAWHALRVGGLSIGKSVLITGASGGVGRFAIQIANIAGASVTAVVGSPRRKQALEQLPCNIVIGMPSEGKYDIILECVGGSSLASAFGLVASYGAIISYGNASGELTTFEPGAVFRKPCLTLHSFALHDELARLPSMADGLEVLVRMLVDGQIVVDIPLSFPLKNVSAACEAMTARNVDGKAVIQIGEVRE
jgi:NADPH:quinone reductase-like Zn-dependent oxidoreductase